MAIFPISYNEILAHSFFMSSMILYPRSKLALSSIDTCGMEGVCTDLAEVSGIEEVPLLPIKVSLGVWLDYFMGCMSRIDLSYLVEEFSLTMPSSCLLV